MDEEAVLVCSPRIVSVNKIPYREWLAAQELIHNDASHPGANFLDWNGVLTVTQAPVVRDDGLHINSASAVTLATLSGQGVAIVRRVLVQQLLIDGQLVQLHPNARWPLTWSYYIIIPQHAIIHPGVKIFNDWLIADVLTEITTISTMMPTHK